MFIIGFAVACLIAALSGMGVGGGGLLVIWLVLIEKMPAPTAQGVNLLFFVISALAALPSHLRLRTFSYRRLLFLIAAALPGVFIGCQLAEHLSEQHARALFGYFLLLSGGMQLYRLAKRQFFS